MADFQETQVVGDVLIFEQPGALSRNLVAFAAGSGVLEIGTVVARSTTTGQWVKCVRGGANETGIPRAVLLQRIELSAEDAVVALVLDRGPAVVKTPALIWDASFSNIGHINDALVTLEQVSLIQRVDPNVAPATGLLLADELTLDLVDNVSIGVPVRIPVLGVTAGSSVAVTSGEVWPGTVFDPVENVIEGTPTDDSCDFVLTETNPAAVNSPASSVFSYGAVIEAPITITNPVIGAANNNVGTPITISSMGSFSPPPTTVHWQWYRGPVPISGAAGDWTPGDPLPAALATDGDDELQTFRLICTPANEAGVGAGAGSNVVGPFVIPEVVYFQQFLRSTVPDVANYDEARWTYGTPSTHASGFFPVLAEPYPSVGSGRPTSNSVGSNDRTPSSPPPQDPERFSGNISINSSSARWAVDGLPNHPVYGRHYRIEMGFGNVVSSSTPANAGELYDGAKGGGGTMFHTVPGGITIPSGSAMDVLGGVYTYAAWDGAKDKIDRQFTTGRFEYSSPAASSNPLPNYIKITNQYTDIATSGVGPFHVDAVDGVDTNDGLSPATAWKHAPGTPGAGGVVSVFVVLPGGEVRWKRGQTHRHPEYQGQDAFYSHILPGEVGNPVRLSVYGSGADPVLSGAIYQTSGWTLANTGKAGASVQGALGKVLKKSMTGRNRTNFFLYNGQQTFPAQWPHNPCLSNYENTDTNAGWFRTAGFTMAWSTIGDADVPGYPYVMTVVDPELITRGTSANADLVGAVIVYRQDASNVLVEAVVHYHNRATGTLKVGFTDPDRAPFVDDNRLYCIRYSPFDLNYEYQFAWDSPFAIGEAYLALPSTPDNNLIEQSLLAVTIDAAASYLSIDPNIEGANFSLTNAVEGTANSSPQGVRIGSGKVGVEIVT